jgi:hypothetical protein
MLFMLFNTVRSGNFHLFRTKHFFSRNFVKIPHIFFPGSKFIKNGLDVGMEICGLGLHLNPYFFIVHVSPWTSKTRI